MSVFHVVPQLENHVFNGAMHSVAIFTEFVEKPVDEIVNLLIVKDKSLLRKSCAGLSTPAGGGYGLRMSLPGMRCSAPR